MKLLLAPVYSLFSLSFYREILRKSLGRGFLYLAYLSFLATIVFLLFFTSRLLPEADRFAAWARAEMPALTWTPQGLRMNLKSPYTMVHPQLGPLVTFDTSKTDAGTEEMKDVSMFVTSRKVFLKQRAGEIRVYDLKEMMGAAKADNPAVVNGETLEGFYKSFKPMLFFLAIFFFFPFFFIWKFLAALFYSWFGLLLNFFRTEKLHYGQILNVSFFTLTPVLGIQLLQILIPNAGRIPFGLPGSIAVTGVYLYFVIVKTQDPLRRIPG